MTSGDKIRCDACPVMCYIAPGQTGACDRYANDAGRIVRTDPVVMLSQAMAGGQRIVPFAARDWDGEPMPADVFVTGIGSGTTYPDYKPAPFIIATPTAEADMVTVVTEAIFSYCGVKVKIDTDRHLGPEGAIVRAQGEAVGHVTTAEYGSQMLSAFTDPAANASGLLLGSVASLCVPIAGAINWTVVQRSQSHGQQIDLVPSVLLGAVISSLVTLPLAAPFAATGTDVAWLALLGLVQLAIPCALAVVCARSLKAPEVSLLALLEVIFGIVWAWLWANETPGHEVLLGGSVVIVALLLNELLAWRDRSARPMPTQPDESGATPH